MVTVKAGLWQQLSARQRSRLSWASHFGEMLLLIYLSNLSGLVRKAGRLWSSCQEKMVYM
jgi:hypothetical protein